MISTTSNISTSRLDVSDKVVIRTSSPTLYLKDTDNRSGMIHMNSNRMYFLSGGTNSESWSQVNGQWPLTLHTDSNRAQLGGSLDTAGSISSSGNMSISGYITAGSTITGILLRLRAAWHAARPMVPLGVFLPQSFAATGLLPLTSVWSWTS